MTTHLWWILSPHHLLLDFVGPAETLRMAQEMGANFELHYCGLQAQVSSSLGLNLVGLQALPDLASTPGRHVVLLPGYAQEHTALLDPDVLTIIDWLRGLKNNVPTIEVASICSAALLLAKSGWLRHKRCTTHHSLLKELELLEPSAKVVGTQIWVEDGEVLTSAGISTGIDLALYLIEKLVHRDLSLQVARRLVLAHRRGPDDPQLSVWLDHRQHLHPALHKAQDAIVQHLEQTWCLRRLSAIACVSERHLSRLFQQHCGMSVQKYIQTLRVARVKDILREKPSLSQVQLADEVGFQSVRDLRRVFQQITGKKLETKNTKKN